MQCLDGVKHLLSSIVNCCESEIIKEPSGLGDPEALATVTVCMASNFVLFSLYGRNYMHFCFS